MAKRDKLAIGAGRRQHLYIAEHMEAHGVSDERLAGRLEVDRVTVTRWRNQQHRLNPGKIAAIAHALGIDPADLWSPPKKRSIDAMLKSAPDDMQQTVADIVERLLRRAS